MVASVPLQFSKNKKGVTDDMNRMPRSFCCPVSSGSFLYLLHGHDIPTTAPTAIQKRHADDTRENAQQHAQATHVRAIRMHMKFPVTTPLLTWTAASRHLSVSPDA